MINRKTTKGEQKKPSGLLLQKLLLFLAVVILPLIVRLHVYEITQDEFFFLTEDTTFYDFFSWNKEWFLIILCVFIVLALVDWVVIEGKHIRWNRLFGWYLAFLAIGLICSILSPDRKTAFLGNYQKFEGLVCWICYGVTGFWGYQIAAEETLLQFVKTCITALGAVLGVLGILQGLGRDPFLWEGVQRWIIPADYHAELLGRVEPSSATGAVYLTMANANYASILLAILCILLCGFLLTEVNYRKKAVLSGILLANFISMIRTNSRIGVLMLLAAAIVSLFLFRHEIIMHKRAALLPLAIVLIAGGVTGIAAGGTLQNRILLTKQSFSRSAGVRQLKSVVSGEDGLHVGYGEKKMVIRWKSDERLTAEGIITTESGEDLSRAYSEQTGTFSADGLEGLVLYTGWEPELDQSILVMEVRNFVWEMVWNEEGGYQLYLGNGSFHTLEEIERWGIADIQHLASGRLYIWEHALPLLKRFGLLGSGPDTFFEVFPQQDFVGKTNYSNGPLTIVEKAHNQYLGTAIEMGIPGLICWLIFAGGCLMSFLQSGRKGRLDSRSKILLLVLLAYLMALQFNDSHSGYSVVVYLLLGIGLRLNRGKKESASA